ncbi:MAG: hypothetical protein ABL949_16605 [Fimbriimonadaceae bacterium]
MIGIALGYVLAFAPLFGWVIYFRPFVFLWVKTPRVISVTDQGVRFGTETLLFEEIDGLTAVGYDATDYLLVHAGAKTLRLDRCLEPFRELEVILFEGIARKGLHPYLQMEVK